MTDRNRIERIAGQVASGEAVDWSSEPTAGKGGAVLRNLRVLEALSRSLADQAANQDEAGLLRHLDETFDTWLAENSHAANLSLPETWGRLRISGLHGAGAYADVLKAWDPRLERPVALKLYRTDQRALQDRLLAEGRRLARIDHPNVVRIFEAEEHEGRVGLWMEFVSGSTLEEWVEQQGPMGEDEARAAGRVLCRALAAVHEAGVLHRDIKAQNVIRQDGGRLVLTDLGSGIDQPPAASRPALSGTPLYLAPEVLRGDSPSVRSDVYSLGALLFYLVSGRFPFEAADMPALKRLQEEGPALRLRDLRPDLDDAFIDVVEKALATRPEDRFGSMGDMNAALAGHAPVTREASSGWSPWRFAAVLVAVAILGWLAWPGGRGPMEPVPVAPGVAYQVDAALYRHGTDGLEKLEDGETLRLGDRLSLSMTGSTNLYVYLFNVDERGNAFGLFPLASLEQGNPLNAGESYRLPGTRSGGTLSWQVDRAGGTERVHLVTSPERLPEIEALYRALPPAGLANSLITGRGIGTVTTAAPEELVSAAPLLQAVRDAGDTADRVEGIWHRVFVFEGDGS